MRFGVLGPLAAWTSDGRAVRVRELKVRSLLAQLAAEAGRVVPGDRLIDRLWGDRLPANPAGALQTRVSQLRATLDEAEPGARRLVVSSRPGYVLDVEPEAVDAGWFETLLAEAAAVGDARERVAVLDDALALWRGSVLADFADEDFARETAARLDELRLTAWEQRAEARLEFGESGVLVGELGDLVARYPLRERLRAAHLRALYQAGRQSEALAGYRDFRARLVADLGIEPGPRLTALHRAILEQDPSLGGEVAPPTNLPHVLGDLVGRDADVIEVRALLAAGRLVTLTGPGGVGKTRLALAVARERVSESPDGTWLVELAALPAGASPDEVAASVGQSLGIRDFVATDMAGRLAEVLRTKRMLLLLDNCEHVAPATAELAARLLRTASELRVLATSQRPLDVAGEQLWAVPTLPEPSAVELFVARATAGVPGFALDADNADAVAAICRRLDGIPLALELAATRVRAWGVPEVLARLNDRFHVLTTGHSGAPARQQTLRAMLDWSWDLLTEAEQTVLRRLSVHVDGWTLRAAEAVSGGEGLDVPDLLARLVDRSLVTVTTTTEPPRYRLLESVAEYSAAKLREAGEIADVERRHRDYYAGLASTADPQLRGPRQRHWLRLLDTEAANLRAAIDHAVRDGEALPLVESLTWYWVLRGRLGEGRRALAAALSAGGPDALTGTVQVWHTAFSLLTGTASRLEPLPGTRPSAAEAAGRRARAEWFLGFIGLGIGELSVGHGLVEGALAVFEQQGDQWGTAAAHGTLTRYALARGDLAAMRRHGETGMALFTEVGDRWGQLHLTVGLGAHAEVVGDYDRAAELHRDGLRIAEDLDLRTEVSDKLSALGRIALLIGDHEQADELHERARAQAVEQGYTIGEEFAELGLALSARRQGRFDEAEARLHPWLAHDRRLESDLAVALILAELGFIAEQRGDAEAACTLHLEGLAAARNAADPRAIALALEGLAGVQALCSAPEQAARLLGAATGLRAQVGAPLPAGERGDVERIAATCRGALTDEVFASAFDHGLANADSEVNRLVPAHLPGGRGR
ncbi:transcriptional regulator, winged helix family [Kribbella flavida DSM 17836]|uniref:Transcriptional regulator, winged helix family n=1 Tax=Kribbella flavida (strain DSM 17836 / JCM 10339 / NBRC 14399) TaxID=479435 RepID=D2PSJ3_KRIFD|nr:BTAD domain-containing putative transcriptional regulator [Kribbella flavida]ADB33131.1 transcriptional regulator, winged helix family [Kribbella flavida DSM 17836]